MEYRSEFLGFVLLVEGTTLLPLAEDGHQLVRGYLPVVLVLSQVEHRVIAEQLFCRLPLLNFDYHTNQIGGLRLCSGDGVYFDLEEVLKLGRLYSVLEVVDDELVQLLVLESVDVGALHSRLGIHTDAVLIIIMI